MGRHLAPGAVFLWSTDFSPSPEASFLSSAQKSTAASCLSTWLTGEKAAGLLLTEEQTEGGSGRGQARGTGQVQCVFRTWLKGPCHKDFTLIPSRIFKFPSQPRQQNFTLPEAPYSPCFTPAHPRGSERPPRGPFFFRLR